MAKRWKVGVWEWEGDTDTVVNAFGSYKEVYAQSLDTLDLEELILFVNGMSNSTKKAQLPPLEEPKYPYHPKPGIEKAY